MAKCIAVLGVAIILLTGFLAYLAYDAFYAGPKHVGQTIYGDAKSFVKNLLKSSSVVTVAATTGPGQPVMMYSLWEKELKVSYEYSTTWMGSTKSIQLRRNYKCRYGVDASLNGASWDAPGVLNLDKLEVSLISVEPVGGIKIDENHGWWNNLQKNEREAAHNALLRTARNIAKNDTDAMLITKLRFREILLNSMSGDCKLKPMCF